MGVFLGLLKAHAIAVPLDPGDPPSVRLKTATGVGASFLWQKETGIQAVSGTGGVKRKGDSGSALIKITSGSTGKPKALSFTDAQILADGSSVCTAMGITSSDINLGLVPWGHSYGLGNIVVPLLAQGTAVLAGVQPLPHSIATAIKCWQPTVFPAIPALLHALAESGAAIGQLASLRTVITAGATISPEAARKFEDRFDRRVHSFYGSSETGGIAYDASGNSASSDGNVGCPMPGVRWTFTSKRRFRVSGPAVYTIGNHRPGSHLMPDLAEVNSDGRLLLLGRAGRFVKIAGRRLNLAEIELTLKQLPGVNNALVVPHPSRGDALISAVETEHAPAKLRTQLRERLATWKIPKKLVTIPVFPVTARGKPDMDALRNLIS